MLWTAWDQGWTYDEPYHLGWSERFLDTGVGERASLWRYDSKTTIMLPNVLARKAARAAGVQDERALRFAARLPHAGWLALLLIATWRLGRRAGGERAGHLATAAAALDPSLAAHATVATADLPYSAAILLALDIALGWAPAPSLARSAGLGAIVGLVFVAKVTGFLVLIGLVPVFVLVRREDGRRWAAALGVAVAAAWLVVAGAFLFRQIGLPLREAGLRSTTLSRVAAAVPGLRVPVPLAFLTALDASKVTDESHREWNVVIRGRRYPDGVWYYFLLLWPLKTPLAIVAATLVGLALTARDAASRASPAVRLLAWNAIVVLAYFSLIFRVQVGYRYVLVAVPLVLVLAAAGQAGLRTRPWAVAGALALALSAAENLAYFGNPLSFTSALVWPKRHAYRLLADSNIDWGQNRERIQDWLREKRLGYTQLEPVHVLPGHDTLGLNAVAGVWRFDQHRWLREHLEPIGHLGHTYLLYEVPPGTYDAFLHQQRTVAPFISSTERCPDDLPWERHPIGSKVPFVLDRNPEPGQRWMLCVDAPQGMDLATRAMRSGFDFGPMGGDGSCRTETLVAGQEAWWRLAPGRHALCAVTEPNRRAWLPYRMEARFVVLGRGARVNLRPFPEGAPTPPSPESTSPRSSSPPRPPGG